MEAITTDQDKIAEIRRRLDRPLVLIGLMGAGKTRIGRALARRLDRPFYDSDDEIEQAAGMSIAEIFERFGEPYFRDGERRVIARLVAQEQGVIATGGGAVMTPETAGLIWRDTVSLWVRADIEVMTERVGRSDKRPLLAGKEPREVLRTLAGKRYPLYEKADIVIDSHNGPAEKIIDQAVDKIYHHLIYEHSNKNDRPDNRQDPD